MLHLKKELNRHMLKVVIAIAVVAFVLIQIESFNTWLFTHAPTGLKQIFVDLGVWSPLVFILLYVVANMLLTPSYPFVFLSGIVYGLWWGTLLSLIAEVLSATVNYYLGRELKDHFFVKRIKDKKIKFVRTYIKKHGFGIILLLRYLGFYFDIVSYAAGMAKIKYKPYITATFIGFIPYILIYVYAGNQLLNIQSAGFIYSILTMKLVIFGLFLIGWGVWRHYAKS